MAACWPSTLASCWTCSMVATISPFFTLLTLLDVEVGDAAHGGGAQVDVVLGLDLAGAADHRGKILLDDLGGQNLGIAGLLPVDEQGYQSGSYHYGESNQEDLFHVRFVLRVLQFQSTQFLPARFPAGPIRQSKLKQFAFRERRPSESNAARKTRSTWPMRFEKGTQQHRRASQKNCACFLDG